MLRETEISPRDLLEILGFEDPGRFGIVSIVVPQDVELPVCIVVGGGENEHLRVSHLSANQRLIFMSWFTGIASGRIA